jgi:galactonate dehydratase
VITTSCSQDVGCLAACHVNSEHFYIADAMIARHFGHQLHTRIKRSFSHKLIGSGALLSLDNEWSTLPAESAQIGPKDSIKITKLDTYVLKNRRDILTGGTTAFKTQLRADDRVPYKYVESAGYVQRAVESFASLRKEVGPDIDIGVEFHGAVQPQTALLLMKALEQYQPFFYEEPVQSQNLDVMAGLAKKTHIPIATGERVYTKWGFREVLEKRAASILQPDVCYAGGITELRLIAGMAEAYYVPIAPHNPQGPCSLAASLQIAASIPNFLIQERGTDTHENLLKLPFKQEKGYLPLPTGPGLGIEIDEDKLMAQVGEPQEYPRTFDRDDGCVVDW